MANKTASLYIRSANGFVLPPGNMVDLRIGETFYVKWYEGTRKRMRSAGRDAGVAHIILGNVQTDLRRGTVGPALEGGCIAYAIDEYAALCPISPRRMRHRMLYFCAVAALTGS